MMVKNMNEKSNWLAMICGVAGLAASVCQGGDALLTDGWRFSQDSGRTWRNVRVPHDWAISGPFDKTAKDGGSGKLPWKGKGLYRRRIEVLPADWREIEKGGRAYLAFDGAMASPRVKVNGRDAGGWDYGYMSFTLDVTDKLRAGENEIEVACDTTAIVSRWYPGAGIYRRVTFSVRPRVHVLPETLAVTTPEVSRELAKVHVAFRTLEGPTNFTFTVAKPRLWDVDDPHLYTLDLLGEKVRYGIRTFKFTANDGFHLNGRRVQLKGVNLHSDLGPIGMAFDKSAMRRQLAVMRDMGVNAIRTSHNPPAPEMLDLCDEMGFVVWNECFDKWEETAGRRPDQDLEEYVVRNLRQFVRRDRNHPSVVLWSIFNEIWEWDTAHPIRDSFRWADRGPDGQTRERNDLFAAAVRLEDATRPVGCGNRPYMNEERVLAMDLWRSLDVIGWNYMNSFAAAKKHSPKVPVVYAESASAVSSYGFYADEVPKNKHDNGNGDGIHQVDGMDLRKGIDIPDVEFSRMEDAPYVAGEFVWTGIDYLGEPIPFDKEARSSYFGCVDLMGIPKYRLMWTDIAYEPGELKAVAWKNGVKIGAETVRSSGAPTALKATVEPRLTDDPADLIWVQVDALDVGGVRNPLAIDTVAFRLSGPGEILGVGNGDPMGMKAFTETGSHDLFYGKAVAVVRRTGAGELTLAVSAEGLKPDMVTLK